MSAVTSFAGRIRIFVFPFSRVSVAISTGRDMEERVFSKNFSLLETQGIAVKLEVPRTFEHCDAGDINDRLRHYDFYFF